MPRVYSGLSPLGLDGSFNPFTHLPRVTPSATSYCFQQLTLMAAAIRPSGWRKIGCLMVSLSAMHLADSALHTLSNFALWTTLELLEGLAQPVCLVQGGK